MTTTTAPATSPGGPIGGAGPPRPLVAFARSNLRPIRDITSSRPRPARGLRNGPSCDTGTWCPTPSNGRRSGPAANPRRPRATLITDFYSYNTNLSAESSSLVDYPRGEQEVAWLQPDWVGDLSLSTRLKLTGRSDAAVRFELIEAGVVNRCEIDLTTGKATLHHGDEVLGEQTTANQGTGTYAITFANIDDRLTLLVNGRGVFGDGLTYDGPEIHPAPTAADLSPVAVAIRGGSADDRSR